MNKEQQIREMSSDMYYACTEHDLYPGDAKEIAKTLYLLGYRKVCDDEIVIKKSELEELKKYKADWLNDEKMHLQAELEETEFELDCSNRLFNKVCEERQDLKSSLKNVRQETAREFAEKLKEKLFCTFGKTMCSDFDTEDITEFIDELLREIER